MGSLRAENFPLWYLLQSWTIHRRRARHHLHHVWHWGWCSIRREYSSTGSTSSHRFYSDPGHCRPKGFLQSTSYLCLSVSFFFFRLASSVHISDRLLVAKNRSVAASHVNPADWLLDRRSLQADPRSSAVHDLARDSRDSRDLQHVALPGDIGDPFLRRCFPWSFLHLCFRRLHRIQSAFLSWRVSHSNANRLLC